MIDAAYAPSGAGVGLLVGADRGGRWRADLLPLGVATDPRFAAATKTVIATVHDACRAVALRITLRLAAGSVPGAAVTLGVPAFVGERGPITHAVVARVLGAALVPGGLWLLFRARALAWSTARREWRRLPTVALTIATGLLPGVLVTLC